MWADATHLDGFYLLTIKIKIMKIKHLLLIPIIGYLIYLMHHAFIVSFALIWVKSK